MVKLSEIGSKAQNLPKMAQNAEMGPKKSFQGHHGFPANPFSAEFSGEKVKILRVKGPFLQKCSWNHRKFTQLNPMWTTQGGGVEHSGTYHGAWIQPITALQGLVKPCRKPRISAKFVGSMVIQVSISPCLEFQFRSYWACWKVKACPTGEATTAFDSAKNRHREDEGAAPLSKPPLKGGRRPPLNPPLA